jgi:hypothetical protein
MMDKRALLIEHRAPRSYRLDLVWQDLDVVESGDHGELEVAFRIESARRALSSSE